MFPILVLLFAVLFLIFCGVYGVYFAYTKAYAKKPWNLKVNMDFQPAISVLIPVHNEENIIKAKLRNVKDVLYPKEKIELIVADDASEDETLMKVRDFVKDNPDLNIKVVRQYPRVGKSAALNKALTVSTHPIVIVSDADTQWPQDILQKALPYLSDPKVGAITSRGINRNANQSWVTKAENQYLQLTSLIRLGESKMHSTIRFEGGFCAYKRNAFERFDDETGADDSGTALEVVQNDYRAILVPEGMFYTDFPTSLLGKLKIKVRRANQLICLWMKCLKLMWKRRLVFPKRIVVPELLLFVLNPVIFVALVVTGLSFVVLFPFSIFSLVIVLLIGGLLLFARRMLFEIVIDNLILFYALASFIVGRRYVAW